MDSVFSPFPEIRDAGAVVNLIFSDTYCTEEWRWEEPRFKPGSQQREGAQFPLGFAHGCWWHRCWHQCTVSILHWQVQRQTPGEGQSATCPKSHTLGSSPGLPLASPGCLSPAGREKEKTNVFGDAARCQVMMPWGHSCTIWLHIFCGGHFLYPFVGLESCLPFWLCFEHYLPVFLP